MFAFTGTAHEGRMSKRTNIQSTYARTAGIPRSSDLLGCFWVADVWWIFFWGWGKSTQKIMGGSGWGTTYNPFSLRVKRRVICFLRCKPTKNTGGRRRDTDYIILDLDFFCFFLHLGFLKMQLVCGEIFGFQVLQSTLGWRILHNQASCFGWFAGHFCDKIPDIFVHFHYSWLICIPSLSFGTNHCRWYNPLKRMNSSFYILKNPVHSNHNHNTPPNSNQPLGGWVPRTWFFVVIESSPFIKAILERGLATRSLLKGISDLPDSPWCCWSTYYT